MTENAFKKPKGAEAVENASVKTEAHLCGVVLLVHVYIYSFSICAENLHVHSLVGLVVMTLCCGCNDLSSLRQKSFFFLA